MKPGVGVNHSNVIMFARGAVLKRSPVQMAPVQAANNNFLSLDRAAEPVKTVTLRKKLDKSGVTIKIKVPVSEYFGVAVATSISEDGVLSSSIELVHKDCELNYQVYKETGNADVVAEWQNWGRQLRLPLFIRAGNGELMAYSQQVDGVMLGQNTARRKTASEAGRRPRFLNRRKPGFPS
ncbi:hypothetical protein MNBD_ALPHA12-2075 [hydrothermal vent metagenome]|uniref:Uncharacterized protein n=1 Tax=hydrothermal vent metagenome TaxID=652676 RepID=A0A3B0TY83_9ZZZZ